MQCRLSLEEAEAGVQLLVLAPLPPPVEGRWRQLCLEALSKSFAVKHCRHSEESIYSEEDMGRRQRRMYLPATYQQLMVGEVARGLSLFGSASSELKRCNCSVVV